MTHRFILVLVYAMLSMALLMAASDDDPAAKSKQDAGVESRRAAQRGLEPFNDWVGEWGGTGQLKRMSAKGAWREEVEFAWKLDRESAGIEMKVKDGKHLRDGVLRFDPEKKKYQFTAHLPDDSKRTYVGDRAEKGKLVLTSSDDDAKTEDRLTFNLLGDDRMTLLIETRTANQTTFNRVAEIGYTRKGGNFAVSGDGYPKCIVTGGRGTMTVAYMGKTYYVCCTGCRQAFQDDPEGIIAEAAERAKKEAAERKKKQ